MTSLYDFTWDPDRLQGVWCRLDGAECCVEAHILDTSNQEDDPQPLGLYDLASQVLLRPGDQVLLDEDAEPLAGAAAASALSRLARIEREGTFVPSQQHDEEGWVQ